MPYALCPMLSKIRNPRPPSRAAQARRAGAIHNPKWLEPSHPDGSPLLSRDFHSNRSSLPDSTLDLDGSVMVVDDTLSYGKTKAYVLIFCGEKRVENEREILWLDTAAIVADAEVDAVFNSCYQDSDPHGGIA